MKTNSTQFKNTKYPEDYKEVFNQYMLKKAIIEKFNKEESDKKIKNKKNEQN